MGAVTAVLITGKETVEVREFGETPTPPGCVRIDIIVCGICGTDIASYRSGRLHSPAVCGHEWVGVVRDAGPGVAEIAVDDRVVVAVPPPCGGCGACRAGHGDHCREVSMVARGRDALAPQHGGFARSITVAATRVLRAHPGLSDEEAAQVEPAAVAFHALRRSHFCPGDTVVVQGAGPIGLLVAQFARAAGAGHTIVVEPSAARRELATALGTDTAVAPADAQELVADLTLGVGADVVMECAGVPSLLQAAVDFARAGGVVGLVSFMSRPATVEPARWLAKEITVVASNAYTHSDFRRVMGLIADGRVRVAPLHTRTVRLDDLGTTLRDLADVTTDDVKVLVDPR